MDQIRRTNIVKRLTIVSFIYLFIFAPFFQVIGIGTVKLFWIPSVLYLVFSSRINGLVKSIIPAVSLSIFVAFYLILISFRNVEFGLSQVYGFSVFFIEVVLVSFVLSAFIKYETIEEFLMDIKLVSLIALGITLILLLNPDWNFWIKNILIRDELVAFQGIELDQYRGFSIAQGSSFEYGIGLAVLFGTILLVDKNFLFSLVTLVIYATAILVNARFGMIILVLSLIIYGLQSGKKIALLKILFILVTVGYFVVTFLLTNYENETLVWSLNFFREVGVISFQDNPEYTTFQILRSMFFLPGDFISLFFGGSMDIYKTGIVRSDIGYIVDIYNGGLVLLFLKILLLILFFFYKKFYKRYTSIFFFFFLTILISHFKGPSLLISLTFNKLIFFTLFSLTEISIYQQNIRKLI